MKIAAAHWSGRISPVFDVADHVFLITVENGREIQRTSLRCYDMDPFERARKLSAEGVGVLLCGAISAALEKALAAGGVQVLGFLGGDLEDILASFLEGTLRDGRRFHRPPGRRRRGCGVTAGAPQAPERGYPMVIAVSASGPSLDDLVDPRFGRCACFQVVDPDTLSVELLENPGRQMSGGAGMDAAKRVADLGVTHVLTGFCGANAQKMLAAAGVVVVDGCSGTVREAIMSFRVTREVGAPAADAGAQADSSDRKRPQPSPGGWNPMGMGLGRSRGRSGGRGTGTGCGAGSARRGQNGSTGRRSG